jgi:hypothetical protein
VLSICVVAVLQLNSAEAALQADGVRKRRLFWHLVKSAVCCL